MFVPAILTVSLIASLLFGFVGADALLDTLPLQRSPLVRHALLGGTACLLLVLAQTWLAIFLAGTGHVLVRAATSMGSPSPEWLAGARRARRSALPWVLVVPLSALATFILGGALFSGLAPSWAHGLVFGCSFVLQLCGVWVEWRTIGQHEAAFARADRELSA